jgi:hypothetical protein
VGSAVSLLEHANSDLRCAGVNHEMIIRAPVLVHVVAVLYVASGPASILGSDNESLEDAQSAGSGGPGQGEVALVVAQRSH